MPLPPLAPVEQFFTTQQRIEPRQVLLPIGQVSNTLYIIRQGCVRLCVPRDKQLLTVEFFLENDPFASLESFLSGEPSRYALEAIESGTVLALEKADFEGLMQTEPAFRDWFHALVTFRFLRLTARLLTHLRDKPQRRYDELLRREPHLLLRIPQQYLASYLGITRVSLSRIRGRRRG